jgi:isochorismate pyruvate lyase
MPCPAALPQAANGAGANRRLCYAATMTDTDAPDAKDPEDCTTMGEVRAGVDALDRALVALLGRRFGYMRAAARIKPERGQVRDEARKAAVIAAAAAAGETHGIPRAVVERLWDALVEESIAYELARFDAR